MDSVIKRTTSARYPSAHRLLPVIPLDQKLSTKLDALCTATGKTATAVVRSLIESARIPKDAK